MHYLSILRSMTLLTPLSSSPSLLFPPSFFPSISFPSYLTPPPASPSLFITRLTTYLTVTGTAWCYCDFSPRLKHRPQGGVAGLRVSFMRTSTCRRHEINITLLKRLV